MLEVFILDNLDESTDSFSVSRQDILYVVPVTEALQQGATVERLHRRLE